MTRMRKRSGRARRSAVLGGASASGSCKGSTLKNLSKRTKTRGKEGGAIYSETISKVAKSNNVLYSEKREES